MVGLSIEIFSEDVPTICLILYLMPHAGVVMHNLKICRSMGLRPRVTTVAEAVGSDLTSVVRSCVEQERFGAAAQAFTSYLAHDHCVAVSEYTKDCIVDAADLVDARWGSTFGTQCRARIGISYPAIDTRSSEPAEEVVREVLTRRGLERDGYL